MLSPQWIQTFRGQIDRGFLAVQWLLFGRALAGGAKRPNFDERWRPNRRSKWATPRLSKPPQSYLAAIYSSASISVPSTRIL